MTTSGLESMGTWLLSISTTVAPTRFFNCRFAPEWAWAERKRQFIQTSYATLDDLWEKRAFDSSALRARPDQSAHCHTSPSKARSEAGAGSTRARKLHRPVARHPYQWRTHLLPCLAQSLRQRTPSAD